MLNYVIQEYTGISGCFTSPLLYGTTLNIAEGRQSVSYIQTLNNIGEVNNPRKWRSCRKAEGVDQSERTKLKERRHPYDGCSVEFYGHQTDADLVLQSMKTYQKWKSCNSQL